MLFRLTNKPATFQRFINNILIKYLNNFCFAYLNDILIYLAICEKYKIHVKRVITVLIAYRLQVDIKKSEFFVIKTKFLGFIISINDI